MKKAKIIGVIGETGSGKSTFSKYIQGQYDCLVIDADRIGHEVLEEKSIKQALVAKFSKQILSGEFIDRKRLGEIVFNDSAALDYLSKLTHPKIRSHIIEILSHHMMHYSLIIIDGVALVEANIHTLCDYIVYVHTSKELRLNRLVNRRKIPYERALSMISSQQHSEFYKKNSDMMFSLNQGIETQAPKINQWLQEIL